MRSEVAVSERRACGLIGLYRGTYRYRAQRSEDGRLYGMRVRELAHQFRRFGYRRLQDRLVREGWRVNHKRVCRLYRLEGLQVRKRRRKRCAGVLRLPLPAPTAPNQVWSLDFMADTLSSGRKLRTLNVVDDYTRNRLAIDVDSLAAGSARGTGARAAGPPAGTPAAGPRPTTARSSPGVRWTSGASHKGWSSTSSQPGKPMQNGYIESFNGEGRDECLNENWFVSLSDARQIIEQWRRYWKREHSALGPGLQNAGGVCSRSEKLRQNWCGARDLKRRPLARHPHPSYERRPVGRTRTGESLIIPGLRWGAGQHDPIRMISRQSRRKIIEARPSQNRLQWCDGKPETHLTLKILVGERGFEPPTPWSRTRFQALLKFVEIAVIPSDCCCVSCWQLG